MFCSYLNSFGADPVKGDVIFADPLEGVVLIPQQILDEVLALMPKLVEADNKVMKDVVNGGNVFEAFKAHRL